MALGKASDGMVSKYINRKISARITGFIIERGIPITPNQASLISASIGFASAPLYLSGSPIIAGSLVQASSILDGVDGEIARARGMKSGIGAFIDAILDRLVNVCVIASLSIYAMRLPIDPGTILLWSMLALSGDLMVSYLHARGEASLNAHPTSLGTIPNIASRDVRLFLIFLGSILSPIEPLSPFLALIPVALLSMGYVVAKSLELVLTIRARGEARDR